MTNRRTTGGGVILCPQPSQPGQKLTNLDERDCWRSPTDRLTRSRGDGNAS
jgi:hypothetical protein